MREEFKVCPHDQLPGKQMIEFWRDGEFIAGIYPHEDGIRVASKYMLGVHEDHSFPPAAVIRLFPGKRKGGGLTPKDRERRR